EFARRSRRLVPRLRGFRNGPLLGRPHVFHYFFAQSIGIAFTGLGEGDNLVGDGLPNVIGAVPDPHSDAGHLEGDPEGAPRLLVETLAVEEWGDWHGAPQITGGSAIGLSATDLINVAQWSAGSAPCRHMALFICV